MNGDDQLYPTSNFDVNKILNVFHHNSTDNQRQTHKLVIADMLRVSRNHTTKATFVQRHDIDKFIFRFSRDFMAKRIIQHSKAGANAFDILMKRARPEISNEEEDDDDKTNIGRVDAFSCLMKASRSQHVGIHEISTVPGLSLKLNVIENGEEILRALQKFQGWRPVGSATNSRVVLFFGREYYHKSDDGRSSGEPLPELLKPMKQMGEEVTGRRLDICLINQYLPGQGIAEHVDRSDVAGDTVVCFSLGSSAVIVFRHPDGRRVDLDVPANSMYIMDGESRYVWSHQMPARMKDGMRVRGTRMSVTFRNLRNDLSDAPSTSS